jgi:DNA-binding transcriptional ArsR family regulator
MKKKQTGRVPLAPEALERVAARFRVLGEPMRLRLLQQLMDGEKNVSDLVTLVDSTQANVSRHLALLLQNGIVEKRRDGTSIYYRLTDPSIFQLCHIVCGGLQKEYRQLVDLIS